MKNKCFFYIIQDVGTGRENGSRLFARSHISVGAASSALFHVVVLYRALSLLHPCLKLTYPIAYSERYILHAEAVLLLVSEVWS